MTNRSAPSRRVGFRLDWCAYVLLMADSRPELNQREAYVAVARIGGTNPFKSIRAFEIFLSRYRELVKARKLEIFEYWQFHEERSGSEGRGSPGDIELQFAREELFGLVGMRILSSPEGLGMTGIAGRTLRR